MSGRLLSKCMKQLGGVKHFTSLSIRVPHKVNAPLNAPRISPYIQSRSLTSTKPLWSQGMIDADITHALDEELSYQKPEDPKEDLEPLQEFLSKSKFELKDKEGSDEVILYKKNGDEEITVIFSLSSVMEEDASLDDIIITDDADGKEEDLDMSESELMSIAVRIAITKKNKGTLAFDVVAKEDSTAIINVDFHEDQSFVLPESAHQYRKGRRSYLSPNYLALDVGIQDAFQRYVADKGLDDDLLQFICDYTQLKRRREYSLWLKNVGNFTDN
ncbi:mitochondrial glycoprotein [Umbelopsis sp. PMI_123]|nr:mitochondrial glycoprotein [Umbelopsis sp. PMI_123]